MSAAVALLLAVAAGYGAFLLYTAVVFGWRGVGPGPSAVRTGPKRDRVAEFMVQAGLEDVRTVELAGAVGVLALLGSSLGFAIFGGIVAPLVAGIFAASFPVAAARSRRRTRMELARDSWPRMIEEIRLLASTVGLSIPQALFAVGRRGPEEMRAAFRAAEREWIVSTDMERTLDVLKTQLADATADSVCETLLIAHEIGGSDIDRRLQALVEDRIQDQQGRKDARSKQAGARFARWFVLVVPFGMAAVGLSIGEGRASYQSGTGQLAVAIGLGAIVLCWVWASRIMRLPDEDRVFVQR